MKNGLTIKNAGRLQLHRLFLACIALGLAAFGLTSCRRRGFPEYPADYREFAYVTNGGSNTVTVLDLVNLRQERILQVGAAPTGITANPTRNEVYAVNSASGTVSVIDAEKNRVAATIAVHRKPYFIDVDSSGRRAYVANCRLEQRLGDRSRQAPRDRRNRRR